MCLADTSNAQVCVFINILLPFWIFIFVTKISQCYLYIHIKNAYKEFIYLYNIYVFNKSFWYFTVPLIYARVEWQRERFKQVFFKQKLIIKTFGSQSYGIFLNLITCRP